MIRYALRRTLAAVPLVLGVMTVVFFLVHLPPGDVTTVLLRPGVPAEVTARLRSDLGLDAPLWQQYLRWIASLVRGDLGYSHSFGLPVRELLGSALPHTLLLSGTALAGAFAVGISLGALQAVRPGSLFDSTANVVALVFYSVPSFWLATMMVMVFAVHAQVVWDWPFYFPASGVESLDGTVATTRARALDRAWHLVLPAATLIVVSAAGISRYVRASFLEVIRQDYVRTARAKGLPERTVLAKHAFRNGLTPIVTLLGLHLPVLLSGTVFVEEVFDWPGMGRLLVRAIARRDVPVVMGGTLVFATMVIAGNLVADVLYRAVDPRVDRG